MRTKLLLKTENSSYVWYEGKHFPRKYFLWWIYFLVFDYLKTFLKENSFHQMNYLTYGQKAFFFTNIWTFPPINCSNQHLDISINLSGSKFSSDFQRKTLPHCWDYYQPSINIFQKYFHSLTKHWKTFFKKKNYFWDKDSPSYQKHFCYSSFS